MVLEVRSFPRAYEAAKFFGPILGVEVVAERARVVNRWFQRLEVNAAIRGAIPAGTQLSRAALPRDEGAPLPRLNVRPRHVFENVVLVRAPGVPNGTIELAVTAITAAHAEDSAGGCRRQPQLVRRMSVLRFRRVVGGVGARRRRVGLRVEEEQRETIVRAVHGTDRALPTSALVLVRHVTTAGDAVVEQPHAVAGSVEVADQTANAPSPRHAAHLVHVTDPARVRGACNAAGIYDRSSRCVGIHGHLRVAVLDGWVVARRPPHVADDTASVAPSASDAAFGIRPRHRSAGHLSEHASHVTRA